MKILGVEIFGADPEEVRLAYRAQYEAEMKLGILQHEHDALKTENGLLRSKIVALEQEIDRYRQAALKLREPKPVVDPFANFPADLRAQIDYPALGLKEPE